MKKKNIRNVDVGRWKESKAKKKILILERNENKKIRKVVQTMSTEEWTIQEMNVQI